MSLVRTRSPLLVLALLLAACAKSTPTQIVVVVDSDWDGFDHLRIDIEGFEKPAPTSVQVDLTKKPLPRRLVLVHDGGPLGPLAVTVSAFVEGFSDPVLVEPRSHIFFTAGQARLLTIDLLFDCIHACGEGKACVAGAKCVASSDATRLVPFSSDAPTLETVFRVDAGDVVGAVVRDGGSVVVPMSADARAGSPEAGTEDAAAIDSGPTGKGDGSAGPLDAAPDAVAPTVPSFSYTPTNFDPRAPALTALDRPDVVLDCGQATFDSSALGFTGWCGPMPGVATIMQADGSDAVVLTMHSLTIKSGSTLQLAGGRPVIFAVYGDARIDGAIDVSAHAGVPGPGADRACMSGSGQSGPAAGSTLGAGGGSGGGFGSAGGDGGAGGLGGNTVGGGKPEGNGSVMPLRGGCSGGHGGVVGSSSSAAAVAGGGGGAVQVSAAGALILTGTLNAAGGGGGVASAAQFGGAGGGSGGAIVIEGETIDVQPTAILAANGGSGGGGQSATSLGGTTGEPGADGAASASSATGGAAGTAGGSGGDGGSLAGEASPGADAQGGGIMFRAGGAGGGGGGVGRIAIRRAPSCGLAGVQSPLPSVECQACGMCPSSPGLGCVLLEHAAKRYFRCASTAPWQNARNVCRSANYDLVHVHDAAENAWLASQLTAESWFGASGSTGTWTWSDDGTTLWSGGAAAGGAFTAWNMQPSSFLSNQCATLSNDGQWRERLCTTNYAYLCQVP